MTSGAAQSTTAPVRTGGHRKPVIRGALTLLAVLLLPVVLPARAATDIDPDSADRTLVVAAIQFAVSPEIVESPDTYRLALEASLDDLNRLTGDNPVDLVVFPEYCSAFLGWAFLNDRERDELIRNPAGSRSLIVEAVQKAEPFLETIWGNLARKHDLAILAGTALVAEESADGSETEIYNRAHLYSADGELVWTQDKVFPGLPEESILGLETGEAADAVPFEIDDQSVVVTICRDTYNEVWESRFDNADLWIDIKANELPYTDEYYDAALAERLEDSPIDRGLTVSLAGHFLGYRFTGITEYFVDDKSVASTRPVAPGAIMVVSIKID